MRMEFAPKVRATNKTLNTLIAGRRTTTHPVLPSEPAEDLDTRHHVQRAIEPPPVGDGVDVAADQERAIRFAARFDFEIDPGWQTFAEMAKTAHAKDRDQVSRPRRRIAQRAEGRQPSAQEGGRVD